MSATNRISHTASRILTGGSASIGYGFETAFNTVQATIDKTFGLNAKVTSLTLNTSQVSLNKLGQVEPTKFVFGQQQGSLGVSFVLDDTESHKIFRCLYENSGSNAQTSSPYNYPTALGENSTGVKSPATITTRIQVLNKGAADSSGLMLTRSLTGCTVNSMTINTSIGEVVNCALEMAFAEESTATVETAGTNFIDHAAINSTVMTPYTFAHGEVQVGTGALSGSDSTLVKVFDVQDVDVSFATSAELLYELGSHYAQNSFRKVFDIGGRFKTTFKDSALLQYVIDQSIPTLETEVLPVASNQTTGVGLSLTFENAAANKSITIQFQGVSLTDHSTSGLEPNEVLYEDVSFKAKSSRIIVDSSA
tara:strand:- start:21 stop:1115 length:1095 start_codon:yes stop_codon:yes gene_type:complete